MCSDAINNLAIEVHDLSKCYRIFNHPRDRLVQALWGRDRHGRSKHFYREFWALRELSFSLEKGQTLGVVGRNGSGKSTMLQLLCGTLEPTTGQIRVRGRIGALLELGSGFNPDFSGLENVYLNATLLGLSRAETEERLDRILSFADIGDFINQPVKTYSSGMAVRLAFAVQAHIDPDVLVVDEALAVGDELFQKKCYAHLERLKERGTAILLVTHSSSLVIQHCDKALLLHRGKARAMGEPTRIIILYQRMQNSPEEDVEALLSKPDKTKPYPSDKSNQPIKNEPLQDAATSTSNSLETFTRKRGYNQDRDTKDKIYAFLDPGLKPQSTEIYPSDGGEIIDAWTQDLSGRRVNAFPFGADFSLVFEYQSFRQLNKVAATCYISSHTGQGITGQAEPAKIGPAPGCNISKIEAGVKWKTIYTFSGSLWPGIYLISGALLSFEKGSKQFVHRVIDFRAIRILDNGSCTPLGACHLARQDVETEEG